MERELEITLRDPRDEPFQGCHDIAHYMARLQGARGSSDTIAKVQCTLVPMSYQDVLIICKGVHDVESYLVIHI